MIISKTSTVQSFFASFGGLPISLAAPPSCRRADAGCQFTKNLTANMFESGPMPTP